MCQSMVNIQSPTAEIRWGKKRRKKERNSMKILWSALLHRATIIMKIENQRLKDMFVTESILLRWPQTIWNLVPHSLSVNSLLGTLSFALTLHIHLTILISARWSATSFSFLTGQVSLPCSILLHTQLPYSLPLCRYFNGGKTDFY